MTEGLDGPWLSPDCWAGKHEPSCTGGAWDDEADEPCACQCPCHEVYDPEDWDEDEPAVVDVPTGGYL